MAILTAFSNDGDHLTISIEGPFNFSTHREFHEVYAQVSCAPSTCTIDMMKTTTIDNAALGVLLLLKENLEMGDTEIRITNCNEKLLRVFKVSNFGQLFDIT